MLCNTINTNYSTMDKKQLIENYKRCPYCSRITNGVEDFYSLIEGSNNIKKSCRKCRLDSYKSYKSKHPEKFKNRDKVKNEKVNYIEEYKEHKRCPACNRKTMGENDYKHYKTGKIVKTCKICRLGVMNSYKKRPKKQTQKERIEELENIIKNIEEQSENTDENTEENKS